MKKLISLGLACGASLALAGCGGSGSDTIKFGIGGPITGSNAAFGSQLKQGAEQAIADLNAGSGILGKKLSTTVGDDAADPKQGVSVANNFASAGVRYVIGHFNSGVSMPTSEIYQENNILQITPASTNPRITERNMWNIFRTCGRDDQQGLVAANTSPRTSRTRKSRSFTTRRPTGRVLPTKPKRR